MSIPKEFKRIADELNKLSTEIARRAFACQDRADKEEMAKLSDEIFSIQSKLRYELYNDATYFFDED